MKIIIVFGTETGESEFVAGDISDALGDRHEVVVENMKNVDIGSLDFNALYIVVCSTYGEGGMPSSAMPFYKALSKRRPNLSSLSYAMFGRGDSTYTETYSQGSEHIDRILSELGAVRYGEYGREDASDWDAPEDLAIEWAEELIEIVETGNEGVA
ncbi:MioC protein [Brevibacterium sandarakinum]|uniref:MioC protein n=1 Tax=Brevibacterium sandarakinum TaxID=629680 RepID=A0A1H1SJS4_BRESA|nr:flavodoxin domain-containing protein [Brevibacterium sandarakinum]SDS48212.1 MioC protein [Brevibacterium sandarakinum]